MCYIFFTFILSSSSRLNLCSFSLNFIKNIISIFTIFFHIISVSVNCWSYICSISFSNSCFCFLKVLDLFLQYSILIVFISNFMSSHLVLWFVAFILSSSKLSKKWLIKLQHDDSFVIDVFNFQNPFPRLFPGNFTSKKEQDDQLTYL